jgi:hypothetical protein
LLPASGCWLLFQLVTSSSPAEQYEGCHPFNLKNTDGIFFLGAAECIRRFSIDNTFPKFWNFGKVDFQETTSQSNF